MGSGLLPRLMSSSVAVVTNCHPTDQIRELPIVNVYLARERGRRGDRDNAIPRIRAAVDHLFREGQLLLWGVAATGVSGGDTARSRGRE
jgi:hypothetical protein